MNYINSVLSLVFYFVAFYFCLSEFLMWMGIISIISIVVSVGYLIQEKALYTAIEYTTISASIANALTNIVGIALLWHLSVMFNIALMLCLASNAYMLYNLLFVKRTL